MASFTNMNFNSDSDSDDEDFAPDQNDLDSDEGSRKPKVKKSTKKAGISLEGDGIDEETVKQEQARKEEFEKEKVEKQESAESKRTDDLWADFLKDTTTTTKTSQSKSSSSSGLGNFGSSAKPKPKAGGVVNRPQKNPSIISSIFDAFESKGSAQDQEPIKEKVEEKVVEEPASIVSSIFNSVEKSPAKSNKDSSDVGSSDQKPGDKITITRVYDFAGENVEVSKEVATDSKEAIKYLKTQDEKEAGNKRPVSSSGLGQILNAINKKPKMGCLDKSKMDWDQYVAKEGIKEELKTFNKGKDGFVEKQMFLERADQRRFELEKAAREKTRQTLNR